MILLAAVNSSPQSAQSGIEWDVSIVHKSTMTPVTCSKYKWEMLGWTPAHASVLRCWRPKKPTIVTMAQQPKVILTVTKVIRCCCSWNSPSVSQCQVSVGFSSPCPRWDVHQQQGVGVNLTGVRCRHSWDVCTLVSDDLSLATVDARGYYNGLLSACPLALRRLCEARFQTMSEKTPWLPGFWKQKG